MIPVRLSEIESIKPLAGGVKEDLKKLAYIVAQSKIISIISEIRQNGDSLYESSLRNPGYQKLLDELVTFYLEKLEPLIEIERDLPPTIKYVLLVKLLDSIHTCLFMRTIGLESQLIEKYLPRALTLETCEVVIVNDTKDKGGSSCHIC